MHFREVIHGAGQALGYQLPGEVDIDILPEINVDHGHAEG
jgi:hypothetical protein